MKGLATGHVLPVDTLIAACVLPWHLLNTDDRLISDTMRLTATTCARALRRHSADEAGGQQALHTVQEYMYICTYEEGYRVYHTRI